MRVTPLSSPLSSPIGRVDTGRFERGSTDENENVQKNQSIEEDMGSAKVRPFFLEGNIEILRAANP